MAYGTEPRIDLGFDVLGKFVPVDHGFALYGAISRVLPALHEDGEVGLKLLRGRYVGRGLLDISPASELVLRLPLSKVKTYLPLAGKKLAVAGRVLTIGVPHTRALIPAAALFSPLVTTRNGHDPKRFEKEIQSQAARLDLNGRLHIGRRRSNFARRRCEHLQIRCFGGGRRHRNVSDHQLYFPASIGVSQNVNAAIPFEPYSRFSRLQLALSR